MFIDLTPEEVEQIVSDLQSMDLEYGDSDRADRRRALLAKLGSSLPARSQIPDGISYWPTTELLLDALDPQEKLRDMVDTSYEESMRFGSVINIPDRTNRDRVQ